MGIIDSLFRFFGITEESRRSDVRRVWAIGDIQGCYTPFMRLLEKLEFDPAKDRLWIAGDLVNRGEGSLEVLEYLYSIKDSIRIVLGNHDISLIAVYLGIKKSNPSLDPILKSDKADELIGWLREQPFVHHNSSLGYVMVHAGIPPEFDLDMALYFSKRLQSKIQSSNAARWLSKKMLGGVHSLSDGKKNRFAINAFTRMRYCDSQGRLDFDQKGKPSKKTYEAGLVPWFEYKDRKKIEPKIIFGHWSTLGYIENDDVICLDTGCIWQGKLTAKRIDIPDGKIVQVKCPEGIKP